MSSAFKNFCITFGIGLLVFGLIGWFFVYPLIANETGGPDTSSTAVSDYSGALSESSGSESSEPVKNGNTFTAVFIGKATDGLAASVIYMRANEGTQTFTYSFIPTDTLASNNIGRNEPLKYLLAKIDGNSALNKLSSLLGVKIDYYAVLGENDLAAIADKFTDAKFNLPNEIRYADPSAENSQDPFNEYETSTPEVVIPAGDNKLNGELVHKIMAYNPTNGEEYHVLTKQLYEAVFTQFFTDPGTKRNSAAISSLFGIITNTNLNAVIVEENMDLIFTYDIFRRNEIKFSSTSDWTKIAPLFRD